MDKFAEKRDKYIKRNKYYYKDLIKFFKYNIPEGSSVLEIGCGTGYILDRLKPSKGVGIDISTKMIEAAKAYATLGEVLGTLRMVMGEPYDPLEVLNHPFF